MSAQGAAHLPDPLPLCAGHLHAGRRGSAEGWGTLLHEPFRIGKRYGWLTLDTASQRLTVWYQAQAEAPWQWLTEFTSELDEPGVPVLPQFARLHV